MKLHYGKLQCGKFCNLEQVGKYKHDVIIIAPSFSGV